MHVTLCTFRIMEHVIDILTYFKPSGVGMGPVSDLPICGFGDTKQEGRCGFEISSAGARRGPKVEYVVLKKPTYWPKLTLRISTALSSLLDSPFPSAAASHTARTGTRRTASVAPLPAARHAVPTLLRITPSARPSPLQLSAAPDEDAASRTPDVRSSLICACP